MTPVIKLKGKQETKEDRTQKNAFHASKKAVAIQPAIHS
jgi:hypothetical protein